MLLLLWHQNTAENQCFPFRSCKKCSESPKLPLLEHLFYPLNVGTALLISRRAVSHSQITKIIGITVMPPKHSWKTVFFRWKMEEVIQITKASTSRTFFLPTQCMNSIIDQQEGSESFPNNQNHWNSCYATKKLLKTSFFQLKNGKKCSKSPKLPLLEHLS